MNNEQRLTALRIDIIRLFRQTAMDLDRFTNQLDSGWSADDISIDHYDDGNGEVAIAEIPHNPTKDKALAETLKDQYSYAYSICRSGERLQDDGVKIADRLIAKWGDAQMLLICPELIHDETPELQADIADMLSRVQERLEVFKTPRTPETKEQMAEFFRAVKGMGIDDITRVQLDAAEDVLYEVQKEAKSMLFENRL